MKRVISPIQVQKVTVLAVIAAFANDIYKDPFDQFLDSKEELAGVVYQRRDEISLM